MRVTKKELLELLASLTAYPPHPHKNPGYWDGSGSLCEDCLRFREAKELLAKFNIKPKPGFNATYREDWSGAYCK